MLVYGKFERVTLLSNRVFCVGLNLIVQEIFQVRK